MEDLNTRSAPFFLSTNWWTRSSNVPLVTKRYSASGKLALPMQCAMDSACRSHLSHMFSEVYMPCLSLLKAGLGGWYSMLQYRPCIACQQQEHHECLTAKQVCKIITE